MSEAKKGTQMEVPGTGPTTGELLLSAQRRVNRAVAAVQDAEKALRDARKEERDARAAMGRLE